MKTKWRAFLVFVEMGRQFTKTWDLYGQNSCWYLCTFSFILSFIQHHPTKYFLRTMLYILMSIFIQKPLYQPLNNIFNLKLTIKSFNNWNFTPLLRPVKWCKSSVCRCLHLWKVCNIFVKSLRAFSLIICEQHILVPNLNQRQIMKILSCLYVDTSSLYVLHIEYFQPEWNSKAHNPFSKTSLSSIAHKNIWPYKD